MNSNRVIFYSPEARLVMNFAAIEAYLETRKSLTRKLRRHCETLGLALGYKTEKDIVVNLVFPYQTSKRRSDQVEPPHEAPKLLKILGEDLPLGGMQFLGFFHSHLNESIPEYSEPDKDSTDEGRVEIIIGIRKAKRRSSSKIAAQRKLVLGFAGGFHCPIRAWYKEGGQMLELPPATFFQEEF